MPPSSSPSTATCTLPLAPAGSTSATFAGSVIGAGADGDSTVSAVG